MTLIKEASRKDDLTDKIFEKYCLNCDKTPWCIAFEGYCLEVKRAIRNGKGSKEYERVA